MNDRILVAGVGNIFLGDDAFGVEVVRRLARRSLPACVSVVDFGIRSYDLAYALMEPWKLVILVDAVSRGGCPGTVYTIEPELPKTNELPTQCGFDAHTMNPDAVLQMVFVLGGKPAPLLVVGCEPARLDLEQTGSVGLTAPVQEAVELAICTIEELIAGNVLLATWFGPLRQFNLAHPPER